MPNPKDPEKLAAYREKMRQIALERGYGKRKQRNAKLLIANAGKGSQRKLISVLNITEIIITVIGEKLYLSGMILPASVVIREAEPSRHITYIPGLSFLPCAMT